MALWLLQVAFTTTTPRNILTGLAMSELPPGLEGNFLVTSSGGSEQEWLPFQSQKRYTNGFIVQYREDDATKQKVR